MIRWELLTKFAPEQTSLEMVKLGSLVPKDHLPRKTDAVMNFSLIHNRAVGLYSIDSGRAAPRSDVDAQAAVHRLSVMATLRAAAAAQDRDKCRPFRWILRLS